MKKLLVFSLLIVMVSCKSDAEKKPVEETIKLTEVAPNDEQLLDTWLLVKTKIDGVEQVVEANTEITFDKNNTYKGFNGNTFNFEIQKDTLLLYTGETSKPEKSQLLYLNESKNSIQLTTKTVDGRVVQTQLSRKGTN
jgi:hypothetical protein